MHARLNIYTFQQVSENRIALLNQQIEQNKKGIKTFQRSFKKPRIIIIMLFEF